MLVIPVKEGENIERALKKYKKKFERTGVVRELRERREFTKPSVKNRIKKLKAIYKEQITRED
jgi:small subunit ribosomal protein S21